MCHLQSGGASFILDKGRWDEGVGERQRDRQRKKERKRERGESKERNGESNKKGGDFPTWQHKRPQQN